MKKIKLASYVLLLASVVSILYCLVFNPADWIVYTVAIVFIPLFIVSLGFVTMANVREDEEEERREEPFIGY